MIYKTDTIHHRSHAVVFIVTILPSSSDRVFTEFHTKKCIINYTKNHPTSITRHQASGQLIIGAFFLACEMNLSATAAVLLGQVLLQNDRWSCEIHELYFSLFFWRLLPRRRKSGRNFYYLKFKWFEDIKYIFRKSKSSIFIFCRNLILWRIFPVNPRLSQNLLAQLKKNLLDDLMCSFPYNILSTHFTSSTTWPISLNSFTYSFLRGNDIQSLPWPLLSSQKINNSKRWLLFNK